MKRDAVMLEAFATPHGRQTDGPGSAGADLHLAMEGYVYVR